MLSPYFLEHFADAYLPLAAQLDEIITRDIARRIMKAGVLTSTAKHQIDMAQQCGLLYEDIIKDVAAYTKKSEPLVRKMFDDAGAIAVSYDTVIYAAAGLIAKPLSQSRKAQNVLQAGIRKTNGLIQNLTKTTASEAQRIFINAATIAEMQVESGAFDTSTALRNAIKVAASDGGYIRYPSGHRDRLDVAVRRAVLTGVNQTCAEISLGYADDLGCDLVETTSHHGARPEHALWQGKIFSRSGKSKEYADFVSATGYGTGDGLCGWNCRHSFYPYFDGLSASAYPRRTVDTQLYIYTQMQRAMERKIRATKRELVSCDEAVKSGFQGAQEDFDKASVLLKKQESCLRDFIEEKGLQKDTGRVGVLDFGHSTAGKAVQANKNLLFLKNDAIIKANSDLPGKLIGLPNEILNATVEVDFPTLHGIVPKGSSLTDVYVMAGAGTSTPIRDLRRLFAQHPTAGSASGWSKKSGTVISEKYRYIVHWYENSGYVPMDEIKTKGVKRI